jgi:type II secretion system protein G
MRLRKNKFSISRQGQGFTLIELLVVISVIGILAALIMVNFNAARERARDVERKSDLDQVKKALRLYYNDNNRYPENSGTKIRACSGPVVTFDWGDQFACSEMVYMKLLPVDPDPDSGYSYNQMASGQDFCLWATLENKSDGDIPESQARCSDCSVGESDYVVCAD